MLSLQTIIIGALVSVGLAYLFSAVSYRRRSRGATPIPGPKGLPFLGNILDIQGPNSVPTFNKWNDEYGPIAAFSIFGQKQIVLGSEKATNDLFVKRGNNYSERGTPPAAAYVSRDYVTALMGKNDLWRRQRKALHSVLASTIATTYEPFIELESTYTLEHLLQTPEDFNSHIERYAYGVIFRLALGQSVESMQDKEVLESSKYTDDILDTFRPDKYLSNLIPFLLKLPNWIISSNAELDRLANGLESQMNSFEDSVRHGMKEGSAPDSWMRYFIENRQSLGLDRPEANYTLYALVGAGTRSPYNAVLSFIVAMMEHPYWQQKLQDEVDRVVGGERLPIFDDLPSLPIVRAIVKEGIRWRSIVAEIGIPHMTEEDDFYEGYFIPKGTILHANYSSILRERDLYPDGAVFNPDRWLNPAFPTYKEPLTVYPNLTNFTSFGYGRRACPGTNFTERALTVMVARIAWGFNIKKPIDPATKKEVILRIQYEPTPNPKPLPFPADITPRSKERSAIIMTEAEKTRKNDPLGKDK
ncbi:cytochrome P450 [Pestalotiopsis sp. NC0098]|nr:cytochrome P450 [Pestalotiopsis sp. NC0098]